MTYKEEAVLIRQHACLGDILHYDLHCRIDVRVCDATAELYMMIDEIIKYIQVKAMLKLQCLGSPPQAHIDTDE